MVTNRHKQEKGCRQSPSIKLIHKNRYSAIEYFLLTTPHKGFSVTIYNSRGNQIDIAQIAICNCFLQIKSYQLILERGENRSTRGKTSHSRIQNQQSQSTFNAECGDRTRATLVEGRCSHHYANPATGVTLIKLVLRINLIHIFVILIVNLLVNSRRIMMMIAQSNVSKVLPEKILRSALHLCL